MYTFIDSKFSATGLGVCWESNPGNLIDLPFIDSKFSATGLGSGGKVIQVMSLILAKKQMVTPANVIRNWSW